MPSVVYVLLVVLSADRATYYALDTLLTFCREEGRIMGIMSQTWFLCSSEHGY